jgi:predicted naringenin-chalcone synthase
VLVHIATALPPFKVEQPTAAAELKQRMGGSPAVGRMIDMAANHSGIDQRFLVIPDGDPEAGSKFYSNAKDDIVPDTATRMAEYERWSKQLASEAVEKVLAETGTDPRQISRLITVSCTGFFAPGLDYYLIDRFRIPLSVKRTNIGFMGCAASLIGFNSVFESMSGQNGSGGKILLVSVELCSLHLQAEPTRDNILANMIFADGCAAALFDEAETEQGLAILSTASYLFPQSAHYMGWKIGNFGFEMILSSDLPKIILSEAVPKLKETLDGQGIPPNNITHWALHPGGRAILDALQRGLQLSDEQMVPSRTILKSYGNLSSASILFVLKEILEHGHLKRGDIVGAVAFGPGLTMETAVLKAC